MSAIREDNRTWQQWEQDGDELWETAFHMPTLKALRERRQEALASYEGAYRVLMRQAGMPLHQACLSRKRAMCYRKLDEKSRRSRYELKKASLLLDGLPAGDADVQSEKAQIELEYAQLDYRANRLSAAQDHAERAISVCLVSPVHGREESWLVLGDAYNVLGSVLDTSHRLRSSLCPDPETCWDEAETCYSIAGGGAGRRGAQDIVIQRAERLQRHGHVEEARRLLEDLGKPMTVERQLVVKNNLVELWREAGEYDKALAGAEELLEETRQANDLDGQIRAREQLLKSLSAKVRVVSAGSVAEYLAKAKECYWQGLDFLRGDIRSRDTGPDLIELHRVMIEAFLHADDWQSAGLVLEDASKEPGFPPDDPDWDDTVALYNRRKPVESLTRLHL